MKTKIFFIILMLLLLFTTSFVLPTTSKATFEKNKQTNWVYLHGIRNFNISNEDILVSGIMFIGFKGTKLIYKEQIVIRQEDILFIIESKHFLQSIIRA